LPDSYREYIAHFASDEIVILPAFKPLFDWQQAGFARLAGFRTATFWLLALALTLALALALAPTATTTVLFEYLRKGVHVGPLQVTHG